MIENPVDYMTVEVTTHPVSGHTVATVKAEYAHTGWGNFSRATDQRMIAAAKKALGGAPVYVAGKLTPTVGRRHNLGARILFVYLKH